MEPAELMTGIIVGVLVILGLFYKYFRLQNKHWDKLNIPCIERTSWWETTRDSMSNKLHKEYVRRLKKYGRVHGTFDFGKPTLNVTDPALIKNILVKDFSIFHNVQDISKIVPSHDLLSKMLFALRNERWKRVRTIISPVFTTGKIKKTVSHLNEATKTLLRNFSSSVEKGESNIDVKEFYEAFAMDLIANVAFATKIDSHNDPKNTFVVHARKLFEKGLNWRLLCLMFLPKLAKYVGATVVDPQASEFFTNVVLTIMEERRKKPEKYNDFIQLMMDASADDSGSNDWKLLGNESSSDSKKLTNHELMANSVMFFFVAFGTTSLSLSYLSYLLAMNPECQEKLIQEVDETLRDHDLELTYDAVQNMKYMDMVIWETLRIYPVAIRTEREAEADYVLGSTGFKIPKGTFVAIPIYALHHDPDIYPDPEKFDPERFSPGEKAKRDPYAYLPFSAGPRNCVGMRFALFDIKMSLAYLLSQFRFKTCSQTQIPLEVETSPQAPLLQPSGKVTLCVETRTDKVLERFF